jgi:uncharacterized zinc-type alcohol dehydrogenase-like protein
MSDSSSPAHGSIAGSRELLDFSAQHGIAAEIEIIPAHQVGLALERLDQGDVRCRFVIDASTFRA